MIPVTEDNASIENGIDLSMIPLLQNGDPRMYSCITTNPYCLWRITPDLAGGWVVRMDNLTTKRWSETKGGFHQEAVAMTLHMWGLTGPVQWSAEIPPPEKIEMVYAIGQTNGGLIKIGRSNDVSRRFAEIQRMSPVPLVVLWQHPGA